MDEDVPCRDELLNAKFFHHYVCWGPQKWTTEDKNRDIMGIDSRFNGISWGIVRSMCIYIYVYKIYICLFIVGIARLVLPDIYIYTYVHM